MRQHDSIKAFFENWRSTCNMTGLSTYMADSFDYVDSNDNIVEKINAIIRYNDKRLAIASLSKKRVYITDETIEAGAWPIIAYIKKSAYATGYTVETLAGFADYSAVFSWNEDF